GLFCCRRLWHSSPAASYEERDRRAVPDLPRTDPSGIDLVITIGAPHLPSFWQMWDSPLPPNIESRKPKSVARTLSTTSNSREALPLTIEVEAPRPRQKSRRDYLAVTLVASLLSVAAFVYYWHSGELLLYGDAVAHLNIARRIIDSRTPGLLQLGTVWLPLPHLLMLPFVAFRWLWQTGIGGSFPSMLSYVFSTLGIFRLVRTVLPDA